ncbi:MAG TPA: serine/threonine-protein kinase [Polyangiaceae bacterium]|jgi:serine/threonine-protein kinase
MEPLDEDDELTRRARARLRERLRDKWTLDALLGVGGMAAVYAATHRNGKRVAIKVLHRDVALSDDTRARFLREGYVANAVSHPGAVTVLDEDVTDDGAPFFVMDLFDGETLDRRVRRQGPLPPGEVLAAADQLLDVLAAAHDKGIIHRDIKPENVFLTRDGTIKVLDFGIAHLREAAHRTHTIAGQAMGTPSFMPPEQARGRWEEVDARSDVWAVGATMYTLLTSHHVHEADTVNEVLLGAMAVPARPVASLRPELPEEVCAIVDRALAFDRADRWETAQAMQAAVRAAAQNTRDVSVDLGRAATLAATDVRPLSEKTPVEKGTAATPPPPTITAKPTARTASRGAGGITSTPRFWVGLLAVTSLAAGAAAIGRSTGQALHPAEVADPPPSAASIYPDVAVSDPVTAPPPPATMDAAAAAPTEPPLPISPLPPSSHPHPPKRAAPPPPPPAPAATDLLDRRH